MIGSHVAVIAIVVSIALAGMDRAGLLRQRASKRHRPGGTFRPKWQAARSVLSIAAGS